MKAAKKKAQELRSKFRFLKLPEDDAKFYNPVQCAVIAVDEIYSLQLEYGQYVEEQEDKENYYAFWEDVKDELMAMPQ